MTFADKLKNARITLNFSQAELAEKIGVTRRAIYNYEKTGVLPRAAVLKKIAEALNVSVSYLMDEENITNEESDEQNIVGDELFISNAKNKYGYKGAREARAIITQASALFAGGELNDEAKEIFIHSLMEVYLESKAEARAKFTPQTRKSRKA